MESHLEPPDDYIDQHTTQTEGGPLPGPPLRAHIEQWTTPTDAGPLVPDIGNPRGPHSKPPAGYMDQSTTLTKGGPLPGPPRRGRSPHIDQWVTPDEGRAPLPYRTDEASLPPSPGA